MNEENVQKAHDFMAESGYYLLLTVDENGCPKGRAFTSRLIHDGKLYIFTGNAKKVWHQVEQNPKVEVLAYQMKNQRYMRIDATAVIDENPRIKALYLENSPQVRNDFEDDAESQMGMFYLENATAEILSLDGKTKETFRF